MNRQSPYYGHCFPPKIISHTVYHRFTLSFRNIENLLAERGIVVTYETIRQWCQKFGLNYAKELRKKQAKLGDTCYADEVFLSINSQRQSLWRAVDQYGVGRHLLKTRHYRMFRSRSFSVWQELTCAC